MNWESAFIGFVLGGMLMGIFATVHFWKASGKMCDAAYYRGISDERERQRRLSDSVVYKHDFRSGIVPVRGGER